MYSYNFVDLNKGDSFLSDKEIFDDLEDIEKKILVSFFKEGKSLDLISQELNIISRERVRQLKDRAIRKINPKLTKGLLRLNRERV